MFCQLAYLNFPRKFCGAPKRTLSRLVEANGLAEGTFYVKSNNKLIAAVAASPRFGDVRVGFFRQRNSDKRVVRFAAVTFLLPDDSVYVAFRGTDTTVLGWKEDFYMSFLKVIPSHILAQNYLQTVGSTLSGRLYVGGHSKGGNLAEYSACMASPQIQQRIEMVFNHDGPGFVDSIYHTEQYLCIAERVNKTIPRDSMVGLLLNTRQDYQVVDSTSLLLLQHNPFTWKILQDGSFKRLNGLSYVSQVFDETLTEWIFGMDNPVSHSTAGKNARPPQAGWVHICRVGGQRLSKRHRHRQKIGQLGARHAHRLQIAGRRRQKTDDAGRQRAASPVVGHVFCPPPQTAQPLIPRRPLFSSLSLFFYRSLHLYKPSSSVRRPTKKR